MHLPLTTIVPVLLLTAVAPAQEASQESAQQGAQQGTPRAVRPAELTEATLSAALASILPDPAETQWRQIAWWPDLSDAIREAHADDKPILLWAMNGHPCGMT